MLRTLFTLALAGLAISAPTAADTIAVEAFAATLTEADTAALWSPEGLKFTTTNDPDAPISIAREDAFTAAANGPKGYVWCETSNASPDANHVFYLGAAFNDGSKFAEDFHGCTQLYAPFKTAAMGFCGDLWPNHGLTGEIAQNLIGIIATICKVNGRAGGRAEFIGDNPKGNLLVYHS